MHAPIPHFCTSATAIMSINLLCQWKGLSTEECKVKEAPILLLPASMRGRLVPAADGRLLVGIVASNEMHRPCFSHAERCSPSPEGRRTFSRGEAEGAHEEAVRALHEARQRAHHIRHHLSRMHCSRDHSTLRGQAPPELCCERHLPCISSSRQHHGHAKVHHLPCSQIRSGAHAMLCNRASQKHSRLTHLKA